MLSHISHYPTCASLVEESEREDFLNALWSVDMLVFNPSCSCCKSIVHIHGGAHALFFSLSDHSIRRYRGLQNVKTIWIMETHMWSERWLSQSHSECRCRVHVRMQNLQIVSCPRAVVTSRANDVTIKTVGTEV